MAKPKQRARSLRSLLLVKGSNVMIGYLGREPSGKWYETGDIAIVEKDGFVRITDRLSRFSKIGGEMVPPGKIEDALEQAYGEPGARHFFVTGIPDKKKGERLVVLHTTKIGADLLEQLDLPNLFLPRAADFIRIDEIPLLGTGKVDLRRAKQLAKPPKTPVLAC